MVRVCYLLVLALSLAGRVLRHATSPVCRYGDTSDGHFTPPRTGTQKYPTACSASAPCLFNIAADPEERVDLAPANPGQVAALLATFRSYDAAHHPPSAAPAKNAAACCNASKAAGNLLSPWGGSTNGL